MFSAVCSPSRTIVWDTVGKREVELIAGNWKVFLFSPVSVFLISLSTPGSAVGGCVLCGPRQAPRIPCQAGLGKDRESGRKGRESKQERLGCVWVSLITLVGFQGKNGGEKLQSLAGGGWRECRDGKCVPPARTEAAGEQQSVGTVWSMFAELPAPPAQLWSRGGRLVRHEERRPLEREQRTSKDYSPDFLLYSLLVGLQAF